MVAAATKLSDPKEGQLGGYRGVGMGVVVKNVEREEDKGWGSAIGTLLCSGNHTMSSLHCVAA